MRYALLGFVVTALLASPAVAEKRPEVLRGTTATVLGIRLSADTFKTVQEKLGPAALRRLDGRGDEAPAYLCYRTASRESWFWFQSGATGGWETIDDIVVAAHPRRADEECSVVDDSWNNDGPGKLRLRMKKKDLARLLGPGGCKEDRCEVTEPRKVRAAADEEAPTPPGRRFRAIVDFKRDRVDSITYWLDETK